MCCKIAKNTKYICNSLFLHYRTTYHCMPPNKCASAIYNNVSQENACCLHTLLFSYFLAALHISFCLFLPSCFSTIFLLSCSKPYTSSNTIMPCIQRNLIYLNFSPLCGILDSFIAHGNSHEKPLRSKDGQAVLLSKISTKIEAVLS